MQWLEDMTPAAEFDLGHHHFSADDIIRFARDFDPQPFHLSEEAGRKSLFKGLAASGWHTTAVFRRLLTAFEAAQRAGAGIEAIPPETPLPVSELRWLKPTLAGDDLTFRLTVTEVEPPSTHPGWGTVSYRAEGVNQRGELVFLLTGRAFARSRASG